MKFRCRRQPHWSEVGLRLILAIGAVSRIANRWLMTSWPLISGRSDPRRRLAELGRWGRGQRPGHARPHPGGAASGPRVPRQDSWWGNQHVTLYSTTDMAAIVLPPLFLSFCNSMYPKDFTHTFASQTKTRILLNPFCSASFGYGLPCLRQLKRESYNSAAKCAYL